MVGKLPMCGRRPLWRQVCMPKRALDRAAKRIRTSKIKASMKRLRAEMADIGEQQKRIKEWQKEVREKFEFECDQLRKETFHISQQAARKKFEEIKFECDQLRKETFLRSQQAAYNQQLLDLTSEIVKARKDNNFSEADRLTQCLRELMHDEAKMKNHCDYVQMQGMK